jgi:hypothetical protein
MLGWSGLRTAADALTRTGKLTTPRTIRITAIGGNTAALPVGTSRDRLLASVNARQIVVCAW